MIDSSNTVLKRFTVCKVLQTSINSFDLPNTLTGYILKMCISELRKLVSTRVTKSQGYPP